MSRRFENGQEWKIKLGDVAAARFEQLVVWSVLTFFRIENSNSDDRAFVAKWGASDEHQFIIRTDKQSPPSNIEVWANNTQEIQGGNNVSLDTWYLVCVTNDGVGGSTSLSMYLLDLAGTFLDDGVTGDHTGNVSDLSESVNFSTISGGSDEMDGDLAFEIYVDAVVTKSEMSGYLRNPVKMAKIFKAKYGVPYFLPLGLGSPEPDWSGNGNDGNVTGAPTISPMPPVTLMTPKWAATFVQEVAAPPVSGRIMSSLVASGGLAGPGGIAGPGGGLAA